MNTIRTHHRYSVPHRVDEDSLRTFLQDRWVNFASATTSDQTQRKHLDVIVGSGTKGVYRVQRRYCDDPDKQWHTIYEGGRLL